MTDQLMLWSALKQIAQEKPMLGIKDAMEMAEQMVTGTYKPPPAHPTHLYNNPVLLGQWLGVHCPGAVEFIHKEKLINAIKEARMASFAGLKEAKEAVEALRYQMGLGPKPNYLSHYNQDGKTYDDYMAEATVYQSF